MSSEMLAAAAQTMGVPETMVQRSAQARADADGVPIDEVLAAWSGGATVTPAAPPAPPDPAPEPAPTVEVVEVVDEPTTAAPTPPLTAAPAMPLGAPSSVAVLDRLPPEGSPVLEGRKESAAVLLAGAVGLFLVAVLFAFLLPALDATPESPPPSGLSALGLQGREIYVAEGCWYCHTQQVRPIVTDANLGPVTQSEHLASVAPDTLGIQRIGPDLAHTGSRSPTDDATWLAEFLTNPGFFRDNSLQPGYGHLPDADVRALAQYLSETR